MVCLPAARVFGPPARTPRTTRGQDEGAQRRLAAVGGDLRGLTVGWALGAGVAVALIDMLTRELIRVTHNVDLATALDLVDLCANFGLFGWAAFRVASTLRDLRAGLEAAVLAGLVAGILAVTYYLVRHASSLVAADVVQLLALNVVFAAVGGGAGAWAGSQRRPSTPDGS